MKKIYTLVAPLLVAALACGSNALAKNTAAEDSVNNWGPWGTMVSPAAGPVGAAPNLSATTFVPPEYKPDIDIIEEKPSTVRGCSAGILCGYGKVNVAQFTPIIGKDGSTKTGYYVGSENSTTLGIQFSVDPSGAPEQHDFIAEDHGRSAESANIYSLKWGQFGALGYRQNSSFVETIPDSTGKLTSTNLHSGENNELIFPYQTPPEAESYSGLNSYSYNNTSQNDFLRPTSIKLKTEALPSTRHLEVDLSPILGADSGIFVIEYYNTDTNENLIEHTRGDFLVGYPTDPDVIAGMTGIATYNGHFFNGGSGYGLVQIALDLNSGSWTGQFSDDTAEIDAAGDLIQGSNQFSANMVAGTLYADLAAKNFDIGEEITSGFSEGIMVGENGQSVIVSVAAQSATYDFTGTAGVNIDYDAK